jgi:hypothetical protein
MSAGPWKIKARHKIAPAAERDREPIGSTVIKVKPWVDRRVKARARARIETGELLASLLYRVSKENRRHAREIQATKYVGSKCPKHPGAAGLRYAADGNCVQCSAENSRARRRVKRTGVGSPGRPRKARPVGVWNSVERPDTVSTAGYRRCKICGRPIPDMRFRSSTCSPACRRAAYRHSNLVNHVEGEN